MYCSIKLSAETNSYSFYFEMQVLNSRPYMSCVFRALVSVWSLMLCMYSNNAIVYGLLVMNSMDMVINEATGTPMYAQ